MNHVQTRIILQYLCEIFSVFSFSVNLDHKYKPYRNINLNRNNYNICAQLYYN